MQVIPIKSNDVATRWQLACLALQRSFPTKIRRSRKLVIGQFLNVACPETDLVYALSTGHYGSSYCLISGCPNNGATNVPRQFLYGVRLSINYKQR